MIVLWIALAALALVIIANVIFGRLPRPPRESGGVVETAAGGLHYVETPGEGPPIVFLHGMPSTCLEFERIRALLPGRHTIAFDRPGYAWSTGEPQPFSNQADAIVEAAAALGAGRAVVVGHSFGGMLALGIAIRHAQFVERLVLVAPAAGGTRVTDQMLAQSRWIQRLERPALRTVCDLLFLRLLRKYATRAGAAAVYGRDAVFAPERHVAESMLARHNSISALANDRLLFNDSERLVTRGLERVRIPVTIFQGTLDRTVTMKNASRLAQALPDARLVELDGGHELPVSHAAEIADALREA